ncbi:MAG: cytochrome c oxidase subunit 3 [Gammaproteobacteria bacterium]
MKFFEEIQRKPWMADQIEGDNAHDGTASNLPTAQLGLRVLLGAITVLLSLFIIAYSDRMTVIDWRPLAEPWLLWLNTAVLIVSSLAIQRGLVAAREGRADTAKSGFLIAGGSSIVFLIGQLAVWQQLIAMGYFAAANPANAFFYLLTALHGIHLIGGLVAWGRIVAAMRGKIDPAGLRARMELCAVYWHYLLVVWLVFFTLLLFT